MTGTYTNVQIHVDIDEPPDVRLGAPDAQAPDVWYLTIGHGHHRWCLSGTREALDGVVGLMREALQ